MSPKSPHVLIVSSGLRGLALAQTLKKSVMSNTDAIDGGSFFNCKGDSVITFGGVAKGEEGYMIRCNRTKLRQMPAQHLDIQWNKKFVRYGETDHDVTAYFEDGTSASGDILVGADGLHSRLCKQLLQANPVEPMPTPYGIVIGKASLGKERYQQELKNGPSFYIVGVQSSNLFVGRKCAEEFDTRLTQIVRLATSQTLMYPPLQLHQWAPYQELLGGRVTILGDAAHPMLPFLGEGANNALLDAVRPGGNIGKYTKRESADRVALIQKDYEAEILPRGAEAVTRGSGMGDTVGEDVNIRQREMSDRVAKFRESVEA
ncbi:uncharacterized protein PAC_14489 [Phialocephala subalpina]|uniref:FAD-binding domain-containing protein n=1 Tax=Phialocephala subalpina TaxID=576137 RepID=A0A1L7XHT9_9HELO|nr:uncharacterized protein PAC_14489 [Phialocephala subalpina]